VKDDSAIQTASPGRRAAAYWFIDGFPDILAGLTLILFGAAGLWWRFHRSKPTAQIDFFFIGAGLLLLLWKGREVLDFLKARVTYPRTGYVQPPEDREEGFRPPSSPITLSLKPAPPPDENVIHFNSRTVMVVYWWCFLLSALNPWQRWYTPLAMPALAVALYAWNRKSERPYRWWSALILALTGPASLWLDLPPRLAPSLPLLLVGAWLLAQGAITLAGYLRANPMPQSSQGVPA